MARSADYRIVPMSEEEIPLLTAWAKAAGWNPGLHDGDYFYRVDPHGFFVGKLDGKIIAMGSAVIYDEHYAFCGFYIVDKAYRGQGYGLALTKERLKYIGSRNAGLDGVLPMLDKYKRLGYKIAYNNARYCGRVVGVSSVKNKAIVLLSEIKLTQLSDYDRRHFPARREVFLQAWINQSGGKGLGYRKNGQLLGYGVIRPCYEGFRIGPLFADTPEIANELFIHLVSHAEGQVIALDIPECNQNAVALVKQHQLTQVFATARMYLQEPPEVLINQIYAITSFELG